MKAGTRVKIVSLHKDDCFYRYLSKIKGLTGTLTAATKTVQGTHWYRGVYIILDKAFMEDETETIFFQAKLEKI